MSREETFVEVATEAARAGAAVAVDSFGQVRGGRLKGFRDLVTDADLQAEERIKATIARHYPLHDILAEESESAPERNAEYLWIIDPIDGTTNYSHGYPIFSVSVALSHRGQIIAGVVYDPLRDWLFAAAKGNGARLNGKPIGPSGTESLSTALAGFEWPRAPEERARLVAMIGKFAPAVRTLRTSGSAALSLCYVAAGRTDLYFHLTLQPWDVAAAGFIVDEAGCMITDLTGQPWDVYAGAHLATNGILHQEALSVLSDLGIP